MLPLLLYLLVMVVLLMLMLLSFLLLLLLSLLLWLLLVLLWFFQLLLPGNLWDAQLALASCPSSCGGSVLHDGADLCLIQGQQDTSVKDVPQLGQ